MKAQVACDGSALGNPGPSGWGVVITWPDGKKSEYSGGEAHSTNQRMELQAAIEGVSRIPLGMEAVITSDSKYVITGITEWIEGWKRKGWRSTARLVANQNLWQKLDLLAQKRLGALTWQWVKGHSGHPENERANELAQAAAQSAKEGLVYQEEAEPVDWEQIKKGVLLPVDRHPVVEADLIKDELELFPNLARERHPVTKADLRKAESFLKKAAQRPPERRARILEKLARLWELEPDWRFDQMIYLIHTRTKGFNPAVGDITVEGELDYWLERLQKKE